MPNRIMAVCADCGSGIAAVREKETIRPIGTDVCQKCGGDKFAEFDTEDVLE